jgi:hypothetical protein
MYKYICNRLKSQRVRLNELEIHSSKFEHRLRYVSKNCLRNPYPVILSHELHYSRQHTIISFVVAAVGGNVLVSMNRYMLLSNVFRSISLLSTQSFS